MSMTNSASNQLDAAQAVLQAAFNLNYDKATIDSMVEIYRGCGYDVSMSFCGDGYKDEDEECDGNDIGDALCSSINCSHGKPTCNDSCTLDYSECLPGADDVIFQLDLTTDSYGEETSWSLENIDGIIMHSGENYSSLRTITEIRCVPNGCYNFTIYDQFSDGICCDWGMGQYAINFDGNEIPDTTGNFLDRVRHQIGQCS